VERVRCYIDGFNLYHAIARLGQDHLKWVNLRGLLENFIDPALHRIDRVAYFSAFATWLRGPHSRHVTYVRALQAVGVEPIMGKFYEKPRSCQRCNHQWIAHEEKSSDVNIAVSLVVDAYEDRYDRALLVSRDSDLAPAVRHMTARFPQKTVIVVAPPELKHSGELVLALPNTKRSRYLKSIKRVHLERALLPREVTDAAGNIVAVRPPKYDPPQP
jgi:hypothetical protein